MACEKCAEARARLLAAALTGDLKKVSRAAMEGIRELARKVEEDRKKREHNDGPDPA